MKKTLLGILCFFASIFNGEAQILFGTTGNTINKFIPATNKLIVVAKTDESVESNPYTNFIQASDGKLYGMTYGGGNTGVGAIFSFDPSSFTYTKLKDLDYANGAYPYGALMQASDGKLYGMTTYGGSLGYGVIFSFDPSSSSYSKLKDFDGINGGYPYGSLIQASDGKLYGMTTDGGILGYGVIFSFDPSSLIYTKLKEFDGANGAHSLGSLMQASNGKLYSMTANGGSSNKGVIFSYDPSSLTYTKLKDFDGTNGDPSSNSLIQAKDGKFYGVTSHGGSSNNGVIFSFDPSSLTYTKLKDFDGTNGGIPDGNLMQASDGNLYGMTSLGGISYGSHPWESYGVIFSFDPSTSTYSELKDFHGTDGANPQGSLIQEGDGKLFGMTRNGGIVNSGVIFSLDPVSFIYTKLNDFGINESGSEFSAGLTKARDGKLYGMTVKGGSGGEGVIFCFDPFSSTYSKLIDFDGTNGGYPYGSLIQASDGKLYGMTYGGGSTDAGIIFSFDPSSSTFSKLVDFDGTNGSYPYGNLIQASDGKLYGMTSQGGSSNAGVIFSFDLSSSTYTKLKDFEGTDGRSPYSLMQARDGKLYGVTSLGGSSDNGVIFSFDPSSSTYTRLKDFGGIEGVSPWGSLMQANDGKLYGTTAKGGNRFDGVIFSFDPSTSTYTKLKDFDFNGINPWGSLMQASDGKLYGMTNRGGTSDLGVIFSFDPSSSTYTKLIDYNGANGANPYYGSAFIELQQDGCPPPVIHCTADTTVNATTGKCGATINYNAPTVTDACENTTVKQTRGLASGNLFPVGITTNTFVATSSSGQKDTCSFTVTVLDKEAPVITQVSASPSSLSPPNHQMTDVTINYTALDNCGSVTSSLAVSSNEPMNGTGDGDTSPDWIILNNHQVQLRAERSGRGNGRVYTITITSTDASGNSSTQTTQVNVPHNPNPKIDWNQLFECKVIPNPSSRYFELRVKFGSNEMIQVNLYDIWGRVLSRMSTANNQVLRFGNNLRRGIYMVEVIQGQQHKRIFVIKE